ncbi:hypothetical protein PSACC_00998 [Paramicrosporidium saccamoebae]|uniref:Uncharacterized protein n=1 Tax=Paramicrosporidium saccamoebae TaxID=1246581 RepID=A0A2H9TN26_9FUNG|nr:hypothetical protein PSACC_00998 [Paramicrosporidium saccamoebae]
MTSGIGLPTGGLDSGSSARRLSKTTPQAADGLQFAGHGGRSSRCPRTGRGCSPPTGMRICGYVRILARMSLELNKSYLDDRTARAVVAKCTRGHWYPAFSDNKYMDTVGPNCKRLFCHSRFRPSSDKKYWEGLSDSFFVLISNPG